MPILLPQGDEAFVRQDYTASADAYTASLRHDTSSAAVWANRAAALLRLGGSCGWCLLKDSEEWMRENKQQWHLSYLHYLH